MSFSVNILAGLVRVAGGALELPDTAITPGHHAGHCLSLQADSGTKKLSGAYHLMIKSALHKGWQLPWPSSVMKSKHGVHRF